MYGEVKVAVGTTILDVLASNQIKISVVIIWILFYLYFPSFKKKNHAVAPNLLPNYTETHDLIHLLICRPQSL